MVRDGDMRGWMRSWLRLALILWGLGSCAPIAAQSPTVPPAKVPSAKADIAPVPVETHEVHNVWRLSGRVLSGSEPEDDAAFAELVGLGVKTIVSVDGIAPRVELAQKHGLRYVHIPIGYDGISSTAARALTRVARDVPGSVYVHCHHGKHRGPAAAAVLCRADDGRSAAGAREILEKAGTGREYPGLWRSVADFRAPPPGAELPELAEHAQVESLASTMATLDRRFDRLKAHLSDAKQNREKPNELPGADDSLQIAELFAESARLATDADLQQGLKSAGMVAKELSGVLSAAADGADEASRIQPALALVERLSQSCTACHRQHRN